VAQIEPIVSESDPEGLAELARTAAEVPLGAAAASCSHDGFSHAGLQRAQEHRAWIARSGGDEVQVQVKPIDLEDVGVARGAKHRLVAGRAATAVAVTRAIP